MHTLRIPCAIVASLGLVAGCRPTPTPSTTQPSSLLAAKSAAPAAQATGDPHEVWNLPDTDRPAVSEPKPTADVLAQKAQEYASHMDSLLKKKAAGRAQIASATTPGAASAGGPADPSAVQFVDPPGPKAALGPKNPTPAVPAADPPPPQIASIAPQNPEGIAVTQTPPRSEVPFNKDTPAVNTPLLVGQPRPLAASDDLAQKFQQQVKDYPHDVAAHVDFQLLQFLQGQSVPQLQSLSTLNAEDREMLSAVLDGVTNFRNGVRADNNMLLSRKIRPLLEMADRLRTQAELSIPNVALCTDVKGFGVYEPIEPARFEAGKEHRVIVYCEVENFASLLDEQKRWETKLTQEVVLYTEQNGEEVWRDRGPARPIVDYSRNRRHDFFIVKMIKLPANLTIGRYLLKVSVVDQQVNRVAENSVAVQIVAQ